MSLFNVLNVVAGRIFKVVAMSFVWKISSEIINLFLVMCYCAECFSKNKFLARANGSGFLCAVNFLQRSEQRKGKLAKLVLLR